MAGALASLAPMLLQLAPSLMSMFGGKAGDSKQGIGSMAKSVMMPFGTKLLGRGIDWITKKIFGTSAEEEEQVDEINKAKTYARAEREMEAEEEKAPPRKKQRRQKNTPPAAKRVKQEPMELEGGELQNMYNEEQIPMYKGAAGAKYVYEKN